MKLSDDLTARHSEEEFAKQLQTFADSGAGIMHVRTNEIIRAVTAVRQAVLVDKNEYKEWDILNGTRTFNANNMFSFNVKGDSNIDIVAAFRAPLTELESAKDDSEGFSYYCYVNPQYWLENHPSMHHLVQQYAHILPSNNVRIVLITPDDPLPDTMADNVVTIRFDPPGHSELKTYLKDILEGIEEDVVSLTEEEIDTICYQGLGMSKENFEMYASLAIVAAANNKDEDDDTVTVSDIIDGVSKGKTEIVNKNDLLELYPTESMENVGGMENLKEWVAKRAKCYSDEAVAAGVEPPKGLVFVGVPGTGKSLAAKAVAKSLGVPLVRLDFGRVFNSLVGKSEERIRKALHMVTTMAPCVLFVDEIDKGLGGIANGSSGDSGTSHRVLGSFLTWLQENKTPVFTMVTANNVNGLPPELLRRGRFDAIFASNIPNDDERREILRIHLRKRGYELDAMMDLIAEFDDASAGYVGSEIEQAVKDGLVEAFNNEDDFTLAYVVDSLSNMIPLSTAFKDAILATTQWAQNNATPASKIKGAKETVTGRHRLVKTGGTGKGSKPRTRSRGNVTSLPNRKK